jgi:hypothetical protein
VSAAPLCNYGPGGANWWRRVRAHARCDSSAVSYDTRFHALAEASRPQTTIEDLKTEARTRGVLRLSE